MYFHWYTTDGLNWKGSQYSLDNLKNIDFLSKDTIIGVGSRGIERNIGLPTFIDITSNLYSSLTKIYPNPVVDLFEIETKLGVFNFEIYNLQGQIIYKENNYSNHFRINTKEINLMPGVYVVKFNSENSVFTKKLFKI